jgi:hypothetical protein
MASGSKDRSVYTEDRNGKGPSQGMSRSSMGRGTTDLAAYPMDNVHGLDLPDTRGCKMGGSVTNLSHSLEGASAVQRSKGKPENSGI